MIVDDPAKKQIIADHYRDIYYPYREQSTMSDGDAQAVRISDSANHLAEVLQDVPALVIPLHAGRLEGANSFAQASAWGSILPAVWSFMMALRSKGMGSAWTTLHLPREKEVAELLGIDYENWTQAGLFPVAYTIGTDFKPAKRIGVESLVHWNEWEPSKVPNRIQRDQALPLDLFGDEAVFEMEVAEIWHRDWVFATTTDAVADPGDFVPVTIGRQKVIIVRGDDYEIRALANVCSHRGAPLVNCAGRASRFSCPYHAWTFDTEGALLSVPYSMPHEVRRQRAGLESFRVETWNGLVFVSLNPEVESLQERTSVINPYVNQLGLDRLHHDVQAVTTEIWNANWKLIFANAVDSYSHFRVHSETVEPVSPTDAAYHLAGSAMATVTGGESTERADHLVISLPPSFVAIVYPDAVLWQSFTPKGVDKTAVTTGMAGEAAAESGSLVSLPGWDTAFVSEDRAICEHLQSNAAARYTPGPLWLRSTRSQGLRRSHQLRWQCHR